MNDMFDNLKELKQKLKMEDTPKESTKKTKIPKIANAKSTATISVSDMTAKKEEKLKAEFKEFFGEI